MRRLVRLYLEEYLPARQVRFGQTIQMVREVFFNLAFGLHHKAETTGGSQKSGRGTERKAADVPQRSEQAGAATELPDPLLTPAEVVLLFPGCVQKALADPGITGGERLPAIEGLSSDFAGVVNAHEGDACCPVRRREWRRPQGGAGARPGRRGHGREHPEAGVDLRQEGVEQVDDSHWGDYGGGPRFRATGVGATNALREYCGMTRFRGQTTVAVLAGLVALAIPVAGNAQVDTGMASAKMAPADKKEDAGPWSATLAAGYAKTSGNSESSAANFKGQGRYDKDRWHHILGATAVGTSSAANRDEDSVTTAEAYWGGFQSQYDLTEAWYVFGSLDWYKDRFSAYEQQVYETAGVGWRILRGEAHFLDVEAGAGAKQAKLTGGGSQNEGIGVLRGVYTWQISENAAFVQKVTILSGSDNTYSETNSELKAGIIGNLSMVLGYTYKHNSDVEIDTSLTPARPFDKTDTFTTISLEYGF